MYKQRGILHQAYKNAHWFLFYRCISVMTYIFGNVDLDSCSHEILAFFLQMMFGKPQLIFGVLDKTSQILQVRIAVIAWPTALGNLQYRVPIPHHLHIIHIKTNQLNIFLLLQILLQNFYKWFYFDMFICFTSFGRILFSFQSLMVEELNIEECPHQTQSPPPEVSRSKAAPPPHLEMCIPTK